MIRKHSEKDANRATSRRLDLLLFAPKLAFCTIVCVSAFGHPAAMAQQNPRLASPTIPLPKQKSGTKIPSVNPQQLNADIWTDSEIADARRVCTEVLEDLSAVVETLPPIKSGNCGAPAPVRLIRLGDKNPTTFTPPPTISCNMLPRLQRWLTSELQPAAERYLSSSITSVQIVSSYACRTRYGRPGARMSEHAFANALDISGFLTADKRTVSVLAGWGLTRRDAEQAVARRHEKAGATGTAAANNPPDAIKVKAIGPAERALLRQSPTVVSAFPPLPTRRPLKAAAQRRAGPYIAQAGRVVTPSSTEKYIKTPDTVVLTTTPTTTQDTNNTPASLFLRSAHASACRIFGTTLGPEANDDHRDHFHIDLFPRRRSNYCE